MGNNTYSLIRDTQLTMKNLDKYRTAYSHFRMFNDEMGVKKLPPVCGKIILGRLQLTFTSVDHLADLYVNKNAVTDKNDSTRRIMSRLIPESLLIASASTSPHLSDKRKALGAAFFK